MALPRTSSSRPGRSGAVILGKTNVPDGCVATSQEDHRSQGSGPASRTGDGTGDRSQFASDLTTGEGCGVDVKIGQSAFIILRMAQRVYSRQHYLHDAPIALVGTLATRNAREPFTQAAPRFQNDSALP